MTCEYFAISEIFCVYQSLLSVFSVWSVPVNDIWNIITERFFKDVEMGFEIATKIWSYTFELTSHIKTSILWNLHFSTPPLLVATYTFACTLQIEVSLFKLYTTDSSPCGLLLYTSVKWCSQMQPIKCGHIILVLCHGLNTKTCTTHDNTHTCARAHIYIYYI